MQTFFKTNKNNNLYKTHMNSGYYEDYITLRTKKGVKVFQEIREAHMKGKIRVTAEGEFPITEESYLILHIPKKTISTSNLKKLYFNSLREWSSTYGYIKEYECYSELAVGVPYVFHSGLLGNLAAEGMLKRTWRQRIEDEKVFYFINANALQMIFNIFALSYNEVIKFYNAKRKGKSFSKLQ